jgi:hypothetical protein
MTQDFSGIYLNRTIFYANFSEIRTICRNVCSSDVNPRKFLLHILGMIERPDNNMYERIDPF